MIGAAVGYECQPRSVKAWLFQIEEVHKMPVLLKTAMAMKKKKKED